MNTDYLLTRRQFVAGLGTAVALGSLRKVEAAGSKNPICIFSKHLQWLDYPEMAAVAAEIGFDGLDLTVRPRGHVLPERVVEDLPRALEAARSAGISVPTMSTAVTDPEDPHTEPVLKTAAGLGIRYYRMGYYLYDDDHSIDDTLADARRQLEGLVRLNQHYGITGDYQNHAGVQYVGAPVWDLREIMRGLPEEWLGCQFDPRHATVEGANSWPIDFRTMASRTHTVIAKDFRWEKGEEGWRAANCPLGEGMVDFPAFFKQLSGAGFSGPVILHLEYPLGGANSGESELTVDRSVVIEAMKKDLATLKGWLATAGL